MSNYFPIIAYVMLFSATTAASITLLGDRSLISGNLFAPASLLKLALHWKVWTSLVLAVIARISFVCINHHVLRIPRLAPASTSITAFVTCFAFVVMLLSNAIFLREQLSPGQWLGSATIFLGIFLILH